MDAALKSVMGLLIAVSCSHAPARQEPDVEPSPEVIEAYNNASQRLVDGFLEDNWVVSRHPDGSPEHQGDSLIWTGVALAALDCARGDAIADHLREVITHLDGALVRYEPLGEYEGGREISLDGAIGLYYGIASRIVRCPLEATAWHPVLDLHRSYLIAHNYKFNAAAEATLPPGFDYVFDSLAHSLGLADRPNDNGQVGFENQMALWALGVNATHAAAYRVNLALLSIQTLEFLGMPATSNGRDAFCSATKGMDIPTVDSWCSRADLKTWIASFVPNQWEYRHQRAGAWETPDGKDDTTPGLDLLIAYRGAYNL